MGRYRYRLAAWNAYGWSPYATVGDCVTDNISLPCEPCERLGNCQAPSAAGLAMHGASPLELGAGHISAWVVGLWSAAAGALVIVVVFVALPKPRSHVIRGARQVTTHADSRTLPPCRCWWWSAVLASAS